MDKPIIIDKKENKFYKSELELKQKLFRKEQECQQLINKNNRLEEELNAIKLLLEGKNNQYAAKMQECETLASQLDFEAQKKECLEQECEELKKELVLTDDFKIMTKRAFTAFKAKDEKAFVSAIRYIFRELKYNEQEQYIKYLFLKLECEVENE